ncbi:tigger transposable element-derived protein 6-like [Dreissena polymorpha]|uniref:tigger transposable element-derived protein 6-like n=1 Tax=Dreissena polymorpha TaxID=45954 RepID=UPI002264482F|nr:tigger transposable element-derived protein 6-like [Dreissena polymorpha]
MTGEKLKPLVIGKSRKPRCFGSIDVRKLPVRYEANRKAWMITPLMEDWLRDLDRQMGKQKRNILLLLDNAPVHPDIKLKNVNFQFLPPNTTSLVQPMDAGIIQAVKLKFRKRQLKYVLEEMDRHPTKLGPEILRDISILDAIYWISAAWRELSTETISKCFGKCGLIPDFLTTGDHATVVSDTDFEPEDDLPLSMLRVSKELFSCDITELDKIDNNLPTCDNNMDFWERPAPQILADLNGNTAADAAAEHDEDDDGTEAPKCVSVSEAAECLQKLRSFAVLKNDCLLNSIMEAQDVFIKYRMDSSVKQSKISDFFK